MLGLITEYNPFHDGHYYHLNESVRHTGDEDVVAMMSGDFVQRGEPAIFDKYARTKTALDRGVDLVIEYPSDYSTQCAELFARNAVYLLDCTSIVDKICFGTESGDINEIIQSADNTNDGLRDRLKAGMSYPRAMDGFAQPNNILGVEYIRAIKYCKSAIKPYTIKRDMGLLSSTKIRERLRYENVSNAAYMDNLSPVLHYILSQSTAEQIANIADTTEGLENRIITTAQNHFRITDILNALKTKRYTMARLRRCLLNIMLGITKDIQQSQPQFIRVLGFRKSKEWMVSELKRNAKLPVIVNFAKEYDVYLERTIKASELYAIARGEKVGGLNDFQKGVITV
jgi:predicted nucleotidyltransferase